MQSKLILLQQTKQLQPVTTFDSPTILMLTLFKLISGFAFIIYYYIIIII